MVARLIVGVCALSLFGCDTRSDEEISTRIDMEIRQRCLSENASLSNQGINPSIYCGCVTERMTEGKSTADYRQMDQEPASYLKTPDSVTQACRKHSAGKL